MDQTRTTKSDATEPGKHTPVVLPKRDPAPPRPQRPSDRPTFTDHRAPRR